MSAIRILWRRAWRPRRGDGRPEAAGPRVLLAGGLVALVLALAGSAPAAPAEPGGAPLPERLDNPQHCAFAHHTLAVTLDPETAGLKAIDSLLIVHAPQTPARINAAFLLNRSLEIRKVRASIRSGLDVTSFEQPRWNPCDFWFRPPYTELSGWDDARQVELRLRGSSVWPESILVIIEYNGTVYDSLKPPPESYQRGFETSRGLIDPRGVYLCGQSLWYPLHFEDALTFRLTTHLPDGWESVSQGRRREVPGGVRWDSPEPMDEIYLVAGPYLMRAEDHRGVAVQTFTYGHDDEDLARRYMDATARYLDLYDQLIGPYPFPKFALVENFWQTGYGMPSFTLLGDRVVRLPFIIGTSYGHEILHNWWGNGVFVDADGGNWCEGLTVYGADYLYKERESAQAASEYRRTQLQGYLDYVRTGKDFPLTQFRERHSASSQAIGYGKSMMVFHMLRRRLGDDRFWAGLQDFYARYRFRHASWEDLLDALGAAGGEDLSAFHEQWIVRPGAPLLTLAAADLDLADPGAVALTYTLTQQEPFYDLRVPLRVTYADGQTDDWEVPLSGPEFTETRHLPRQPVSLAVDPDFDIFRRLHRAEVPAALSQLHGADSVTVVLSSAGPAPVVDVGRRLADLLARAKPVGRGSDRELALADLRTGAAWILGQPLWIEGLRDLLPPGVQIDAGAVRILGQSWDRADHTVVLALPHPNDPDEALGVLIGGNPADWEEIWNKLPHYGKYSYLVFAGTTNVAKGIWPVLRSPLRVVWDAEETGR
jgi:aminopeptidase N